MSGVSTSTGIALSARVGSVLGSGLRVGLSAWLPATDTMLPPSPVWVASRPVPNLPVIVMLVGRLPLVLPDVPPDEPVDPFGQIFSAESAPMTELQSFPSRQAT